jgi:hypothetical protein
MSVLTITCQIDVASVYKVAVPCHSLIKDAQWRVFNLKMKCLKLGDQSIIFVFLSPF